MKTRERVVPARAGCYVIPMRRSVLALTLVFAPSPVLALGLGACGAVASEPAAVVEYATRGVVRSIDLAQLTVTIAHENVPGYMPAMTMPFSLQSATQLGDIHAGDAVEFRFRPEAEGRHVIVSIARRR